MLPRDILSERSKTDVPVNNKLLWRGSCQVQADPLCDWSVLNAHNNGSPRFLYFRAVIIIIAMYYLISHKFQ